MPSSALITHRTQCRISSRYDVIAFAANVRLCCSDYVTLQSKQLKANSKANSKFQLHIRRSRSLHYMRRRFAARDMRENDVSRFCFVLNFLNNNTKWISRAARKNVLNSPENRFSLRSGKLGRLSLTEIQFCAIAFERAQRNYNVQTLAFAQGENALYDSIYYNCTRRAENESQSVHLANRFECNIWRCSEQRVAWKHQSAFVFYSGGNGK